MIKKCDNCGLKREHRKRSDSGKLNKRCNECLASYGRRWRQENWKRRKAYDTWKGMIRRCYDQTTLRWQPGTGVPSYRDYGALGITVCGRWRDPEKGFENFVADMGWPPEPESTLDRRRPRRNYTPTNCRWVDKETQDQNRKNTVWVTAIEEGSPAPATVTLCLSEWGRRTGIDRRVISKRLGRGWAAQRAVSKPTPTSLQIAACPF